MQWKFQQSEYCEKRVNILEEIQEIIYIIKSEHVCKLE